MSARFIHATNHPNFFREAFIFDLPQINFTHDFPPQAVPKSTVPTLRTGIHPAAP